MINLDIMSICDFVLSEARPFSPIRTGNLRYNAMKSQAIEYGSFAVGKVYVDEEIAPYMPYTNEPWISPRWHGKKNPHEGWFDGMVESVALKLARELGGTMEVKDD